MRWRPLTGTVYNIFCPTGEGGGVDPRCSPKSHAALDPIADDPDNTASKFPRVSKETRQRADEFASRVRDKGIDISTLGSVESVDLADLKTGQSRVKIDTVRYFLEGGRPGDLERDVIVFRVGKELYLKNGNNRATAALVSGKTEIPARVIDVDED